MKANELRPGMIIKEYTSNGRTPVEIKVKEVSPCSGHKKGIGRTHVNSTLCYDNAVEMIIKA